jgi:hypothetical protein
MGNAFRELGRRSRTKAKSGMTRSSAREDRTDASAMAEQGMISPRFSFPFTAGHRTQHPPITEFARVTFSQGTQWLAVRTRSGATSEAVQYLTPSDE